MLLPYIVGREYRDKLRWRRCLFHRRSSFRFFALHQAHDAGNVEAELAGGFDGLNCGGAGGADVVDNDDACAFLAEPFNALSGAARSAKLSGDNEKAKTYYAQLLANCDKADGNRPELQDARSLIAQK